MTLPLRPARAGRRIGWRSFAAVLLIAVALAGPAYPLRAEEADPFSATVPVDATADSVAKARDLARVDGQRRALATVAQQLAGGDAPTKDAQAKLAKLDDSAITNLVASFEVANERMSAVRYVAEYTFHFRPADTRRALRAAGIAATEDAGKPLVVLPVFKAGAHPALWDDPNPWREAWEQRPAATGPLRLIVPLGDAGDIAAVDAGKARAGDAEALAAIAKRNGGEDVAVALAELRGSPDRPTGVDVTVRRYRAGRPLDSHIEPLAANPGEAAPELLRRAVAAVITDIDSGWKKEAGPPLDQQGSLTAVLPIDGLDDWLRARDRLASVPAVRKVALVALSLQEATVEIDYLGSIDQLKSGLAKISFDLVHGEPLWRLAHTGALRSP